MNSNNNTLLVDTSPDGDFLTSNGELVWPIKNEFELKDLKKLAKLFGSNIKKVSGQTEHSLPRKEEVVTLGEKAKKYGLLYAHLTGRSYRLAKNKKELLRGKVPAILIINPRLVDVELLEFLYTPQENSTLVPGLIFFENSKQLRRQILISSAASHLCGKLESIRIDIHPTFPFGRKKAFKSEFLGAKALANDVRSAIGKGAGLLVMSTHSDGIDAKLGTDLTLCPMKEIQNNPSQFFSPTCQTTQFCYRHQIPVKEFLQSEYFLSTDDVSARIFIFNSCYGIRLQSGMIDIGWSLAQQLSNSSIIGAIATTWELVITKENQTEILASNLLEGMTIGEAVSLYNNSSESKLFGRHRLCLLGDPKVRLPANNFNPGNSNRNKHSRKDKSKTNNNKEDRAEPIETIDESLIPQTNFFDVCFSYLANSSVKESDFLIIKNALTKIDSYKEAIQNKASKEDIKLCHDEMLEAISANIIDQNPSFYPAWMPLANKFKTQTSLEECKVCQQPRSVSEISIKLTKNYHRRFVTCPNCGDIEDSPSSLNLKLFLDKQNLILRGKLPKKDFIAKVIFKTSNTDLHSKVWDWQMIADGRLEQSFEIPNIQSPGLGIISVVVVWAEGFLVLKQLTRAFQNNPQKE